MEIKADDNQAAQQMGPQSRGGGEEPGNFSQRAQSTPFASSECERARSILSTKEDALNGQARGSLLDQSPIPMDRMICYRVTAVTALPYPTIPVVGRKGFGENEIGDAILTPMR